MPPVAPRIRSLLFWALSCASQVSAQKPSSQCSLEKVAALLTPDNQAGVLTALHLSDNGTFGEVGNIAYPKNATHLPSLCVVSVNVTSSSTSSYTFGLFLPDGWNHRFLAVGNGGFSGGINWYDMGTGVKYGFATMSTSTGHNSSNQDMGWALNNPETKADWAGRSLHGSTVVAKQIVEGYYGVAANRSYYSGCSTGGRQGVKSAQDHPEDFDGILAGAPAWMSTSQQLWQLKVGAVNLPEEGPGYLPPAIFEVISDEVLQQCDGSDGIVDGVIMDPAHCNFRPEKLLCNASSSTTNRSACLTAPQVSTLRQLYLPLVQLDANVHNVTYVYPNFGLGSEQQMPASFGTGNEPSLYGTEYAKNYLFDDPSWDWTTQFDYSTFAEAARLNPGNVNADHFDLSAFHGRGGKLVQYHGYADGLIPTDVSRVLYDETWAAMAARGVDLDEFYRLFFVPGMQHCSGGVYDAPWYFGGSGHAADLESNGQHVFPVPGVDDARHDVLLALVAWVEGGEGVREVVATKFVNDTVGEGMLRQRPIYGTFGLANYPALFSRPSQIRRMLEDDDMPVDDAPEDEGQGSPRQTYNFAPGYHGVVYRADVPDRGAVHRRNHSRGEQDSAAADATSSQPKNSGGIDDSSVKYKMQSMQWGLIPFWTKRDPGYAVLSKTINCRDDSLSTPGGMWSTMKAGKRCIVVAQGFYEWLKNGKEKMPHFVKRRDGQLMCFAGLWDCAQYEDSQDKRYTYTIITTDSNKQLKFLHDRMPVILNPGSKEIKTWLDPKRHEWSKELQDLLKPFDGQLECYPVSKEVGKVGNNSPSFIIPVASKENKANIANFFANASAKQKSKEATKLEPSVEAREEQPGESQAGQDQPVPEAIAKADEEKDGPEVAGIKRDAPDAGGDADEEPPRKTSRVSPVKSRQSKINPTSNGNKSPVKAKQGGTQKITKFFANSS
ncbi:tannase and feruloyl esterase [Colletotrichum orchidophilum]|uniref:Carboxylic ester hydrolase n=1 Tax=Colletotrichum orchidophilum TaxID=1209926 RepID=A0A1G4BJN4_9PEZI|nr:tannase and feruloyl esterase [Colletotrichum orchidophilum]OHF01497.1 tannase and feruloyl esterase [Colletotrichum orchidophilum]